VHTGTRQLEVLPVLLYLNGFNRTDLRQNWSKFYGKNLEILASNPCRKTHSSIADDFEKLTMVDLEDPLPPYLVGSPSTSKVRRLHC
jgi:hypothetical protein